MRSARTDLVLGGVATLSMGVPFLLIAVAQRAMSTPVMAAARVVLAAAALLILVRRRGGAPEHARAAVTRHPVALVVVALSAAVLPNLLIGSAERHVPSGTVAVLLATTPLCIAVGAALTRSGERFGARQWVAAPLALVGVGWASRATTPTGALVWCLLPLAAAVSYAVATLVIRRHLADVSPLVVTAAEMVVASVVLAPIAAAHPGPLRWQPAAWAAVVVAGIGCSGLGWLANTALVQRVGASRASVTSYTCVVVSVLLGAVVLGEPLTAQVLAGTAVLVVAVVVFTWRRPLVRRVRKTAQMIELCILGFLAEAPLHAYGLRRRITALIGHVRPLSDGALTPALRRLEARGLLVGHDAPGERGPSRRIFELTAAGRAELRRRLAEPAEVDITDRSRYFTLLAFLHELDDPARQRAVLERRLAFLEEPSRGFFLPEQEPLPGDASVFRDGMNHMARDIWTAEHAWLRRTLVASGA